MAACALGQTEGGRLFAAAMMYAMSARRFVSITLAVFLVLGAATTPECAAQNAGVKRPDGGDRVIAIDVLLLPDAKMAEAAIAANSRLRKNYPAGYTLGHAQVAHITLAQRYVREKDLPAMNAAVAKVCERAKPLQWKLQATGTGNGVWSGLAITYINVERTKQLDRFQAEIVKAVEPFAVRGGTSAAFSTSKELPKIQDDIVQYVETFVPKASGEKFSPHVTFGVAKVDFVNRMKSEPFRKFVFKVRAVATYQLGNFGTAQKKLWEWHTADTIAE
jgi:2'-5' RNA ligase